VTPAAGFVEPWAAAVIGFLAGVVCYLAVQFRMRRDWDDALDVWGVHGVGGTLGVICTGIFASAAIGGASGLIEGNWQKLGVQVLAAVITVIYAFVVTWGILKVLNIFEPVRVPDQVEQGGLDQALHGEAAYDLA